MRHPVGTMRERRKKEEEIVEERGEGERGKIGPVKGHRRSFPSTYISSSKQQQQAPNQQCSPLINFKQSSEKCAPKLFFGAKFGPKFCLKKFRLQRAIRCRTWNKDVGKVEIKCWDSIFASHPCWLGMHMLQTHRDIQCNFSHHFISFAIARNVVDLMSFHLSSHPCWLGRSNAGKKKTRHTHTHRGGVSQTWLVVQPPLQHPP